MTIRRPDARPRPVRHLWRRALRPLAGLLLSLSIAGGAAAQGVQKGPSGFPLPRFVSIKSHPVNIRQGPSKDHDIAWTFMRSGVPVEITQEFDIWFRVRDSEGQEGWVQKTLLSGKRTALVTPWEKTGLVPMRDRGSAAGAVIANLEPNVLLDIAECDGTWCKVVAGGSVKGYVEQGRLWGVYPSEKYPSD